MVYKKSDFTVFTWLNKRNSGFSSESFYLYPQDQVDEYIVTREVILTDFLPLTDQSVSLLRMLHPALDIDQLAVAIREWEEYDVASEPDAYFYWSFKDGRWR